MSYLSLIKAKDAPFAPTGRKTAPRTHFPGAFRALRARNSPPHPSVADFAAAHGGKQASQTFASADAK